MAEMTKDRSVLGTKCHHSDMAAALRVARSKLKVKHSVAGLVHTTNAEWEEKFKKNVQKYCDKHKYGLGALQSHCFIGHPKENVRSASGSDIVSEYKSGESEFEDYFLYSEPFSESKVWDFLWITKNNSALGTFSKTMFWKGYEILEKYAENEPLTSQESVALSALRRFISEKGRHEESLKSLRTKRTKLSQCGVASLLAQHFLSQLLPHPANFYLDKYSKGKPDIFGCDGPITFGLTSIGSPELFYGSADIVLFPSQRKLFCSEDDMSTAVFTMKRSETDECYGREVVRDEWCEEECDDFEEEILDSSDSERQLLKQAISLSLCKKNHLKNEQKGDMVYKATTNTACIIPVCGISSNTYDIAMYDAENDCLLKMYDDQREIFDGDELMFSAVIDIWMVIHHKLFCLGPSEEKQDALRGTCGLVKQIGQERYESVLDNSKCLYRMEGPAHRRFRKPTLELFDVCQGEVRG